MHKSATKCNETIYKWCKNKHGASKIIDTFETYQVVALAAGISRRVYSDTRVIFITIIAINIALAKKIGTPLIILVSDSSVYSVSIHKFISVDLQKVKIRKKKLHALDQTK
jgi:hypothetical protein